MKNEKLIRKIQESIREGNYKDLYFLRSKALKAGITMGQVARRCEEAGIDDKTYQTAQGRASRWTRYYPGPKEERRMKYLETALRVAILTGLLICAIAAWKLIYG
jgi:hypothetical protein